MAHVTPFVLVAGRNLQGASLGYHAYSLRVDNISNQWLQEESTLVWIPPYSLGVVVRLWGTSVALLLATAPQGQPQLAPIPGEYAVVVYSDEYRTENPGVPVRQFTLVQSVSDLSEGPQPALPPVGVDRLYADPSGNIHHLHSDGTDLTLVDRANVTTSLYPVSDPHYQAMMSATALGGDLQGTVNNAAVVVRNTSRIAMIDGTGTFRTAITVNGTNYVDFFNVNGNFWRVLNQAGTTALFVVDNSGNVSTAALFSSGGSITANGVVSVPAGQGFTWSGEPGVTQITADTNGNVLFDSPQGWIFRNSAAGYTQEMNLDGGGNLKLNGVVYSNQFIGTALASRLYHGGQFVLSNTQVGQLVPGYTNGIGLVWITIMENGRSALYLISGGAQLSSLVYGQPGVTWTTAFGGASVNVAWSGSIVSGGGYAVENKTGSTWTFRTVYIGV